MPDLGFTADLKTKNGRVKAILQLFKFREDDTVIIYCPAIDLSAYGATDKDAEREFKNAFKEHMSYCLAKKTLVEDLIAHGWHIKKTKQKKVTAPSVEEMMESNETLRDIIFNKDFVKISESLEIPALV